MVGYTRSLRVNEDTTPLFSIQIAAEHADVHPSRLLDYDHRGLVVPHKGVRNHRRYSYDDIRRVKLLQYIVHEMKISIEAVAILQDAIYFLRQKGYTEMPTPQLEFISAFIKEDYNATRTR